MHVFPVTVSGKVAAYTGNDRYVCGNSDFVVELTLDEEWAQHDTKTARFVYGAQHTDIVFTGNTVSVPVIEKAYEIRFGIFAGNLYTTTPAVIPCDLSIRSYDGAPKDPEPSVYDQIMEKLNDVSGDKYVESYRIVTRMDDNTHWLYLVYNDKTELEIPLPKMGIDIDRVVKFGTEDPTEDTSGQTKQIYVNTVTGAAWVLENGQMWPLNWIPISGGGTVKTVNGVEPDENGNVQIDIPESSGGTLIEPAEDDIPKVFFGGALQQTKDEAVVPFRYISKTEDISGYTEIKAQGNSSMSYPKKNQTVKLYKDADCTEKLKVDFKGWGNQNKHIYKANWIDLTHSRNVVSARLWGDVVKSRANYANLPELLRTSPNQGAIDGFPVKVYAAGVYQGRYTLNIPKDKWAFNMDDELDNHCVLCGENYVSGCFRAAANINGADWTDEIHDTVPTSIKTRWNEVISFVMNSTAEEFKANLGNYFYIDSLIDYHLFGLASCGLDAYGKNQIYATYDGQKWIACMYDMDSTWGLYWNGSEFVSSTYTREEYEDMITGREGNLLYIRLEQLFYTELQNRWAELKNGALSIENIINRFERFTDIAPAELVKEDYASTTGGGAFTGIPSKDTNNIQQIRAFALARQAWTDEYVAGLTPEEAVPCTGITLDADTLTFTSAGTQTLTATVMPDNTTDTVVWASDDTSVCTVSGGVVTSKANGNATITATCGAYSDTCTVTVSGIEEGGESTLPTGYMAVDYIQSDGNQYIDTGVRGGTNAAWEIKMNALGSYAVNYETYIAGDGNGTIPNLYCNSSNIASNNTTEQSNNLIPLGASDNVYEYRGTKAVYVDGTAYDIINDPTGNGWGTSTWYVFNSHGEPNLKSSMRLYYFKMWTDGVLVRDFVPAVRESDNVAGLYDLSNDVFYTNAGTGAFMTPDNITEETVELLYSLPETKTFNGSSDYIDTGVKLFDVEKDFSIVIHKGTDETVGVQRNLFHCVNEISPWPGINMQWGVQVKYVIGGRTSGGSDYAEIPKTADKIVITCAAGIIKQVSYVVDGTITRNDTESISTYTAHSFNLLIGCYQATDGTKGRWWGGTLYDFKVYNRVLSENEITGYLNS